MKRILYIGSLEHGHTCLERMKALQELGHNVQGINSARSTGWLYRIFLKISHFFGFYPDYAGLNRDIRDAISLQKFDIVWVDKGIAVSADTLRTIKKAQPDCRLVHLNPDDPFGKYRNGWDLFLKAIPEYDVHFVARTQNLDEYAQFGAKRVFVFDRSYSKKLHRPLDLSPDEREKYGVSVGFIGTHADDRAAKIAYLIKQGIPVAVYGNDWPQGSHWDIIRPHYRGPSRFGEEYVRIINGMGIALHFLRHENRDEQDSRTFELPACGAFMLAERSSKHEALFKENEEVIFFSTADELLEKVRYFLCKPEERARIAAGGRRRCVESGYDHQSRMKIYVERILQSQLNYDLIK